MCGRCKIPASDWEIASIGAFACGDVWAAGGYSFVIRSRSANVRHTIAFAGGGVGLGLKAGGGLPFGSLSDGDFTRIDCKRAFSLDDLDCSPGHLKSIGIALFIGVSACMISAGDTSGTMFSFQPIAGFEVGAECGVVSLSGMWGIVRSTPGQQYAIDKFKDRVSERPKGCPLLIVRTPCATVEPQVGPRAHVTYNVRMPKIMPGQSVMRPPTN